MDFEKAFVDKLNYYLETLNYNFETLEYYFETFDYLSYYYNSFVVEYID